jgi:hypothetical protein
VKGTASSAPCKRNPDHIGGAVALMGPYAGLCADCTEQARAANSASRRAAAAARRRAGHPTSAHDLARTRHCSAQGCPADADSDSDWCERHRLERAALNAAGEDADDEPHPTSDQLRERLDALAGVARQAARVTQAEQALADERKRLRRAVERARATGAI